MITGVGSRKNNKQIWVADREKTSFELMEQTNQKSNGHPLCCSTTYGMPDNRRVYPELAEGIRGRVSLAELVVGKKRKETPKFYI